MKIRIRNDMDGSYLRTMTPIGPAFGARWKDAQTFSDGWSAYETLRQFPMVVLASLVNDRRARCDVEGKALAESDRRAGKEKA